MSGPPPEELADELVQLGSEQQEVFLSAHPELVEQSALETLSESIRTAFRSDVPRALKLADSAIVIARRLADPHQMALALRAKANALSLVGQCREALDLFDQAGRLFTGCGNGSELGRTLSTSIRCFLLLGEYQQAFTVADQARQIFESLGDAARIARLEINVANIYHRQNRFPEALDAYEHAYRSLLPHADFEGIAVALHNVAVCRIALDEFGEALKAYARLRELCYAHSMPLLVAQADYNSALLYLLRGDYTQAIALLQSTREIYSANGDDYHLGLCDLDQSEIYVELRLSEEAVEMARGSYDRFRNLGMGFEVGRSLANLAIALGQQCRFPRALRVFEQASQVFAAENNVPWQALLDLYRSLILYETGDLDQAQTLCEQARLRLHSASMPGKELRALLLLSRLALRKGNLTQAAALCALALQLESDLELPALTFETRLLQGEIDEAASNNEAAFKAYQQCRDILETLRENLRADDLKISLMKSRVEVYGRLAHLCLSRQNRSTADLREAFGYIEDARSRSLRDLISQPTRIHSGQEPSTTSASSQRLAHLRDELNWFYHRIEREELAKEAAGVQQLEALRHQAKLRERELLRLERERMSLQAADVWSENCRPATLDQVFASLAPGLVLLEYFAIGTRLWCAVVSNGQIRIVQVSDLAVVHQHLRLLRFQMNKFRLGPEYCQKFQRLLLHSVQAHLRSLYDDLIRPLETKLEAAHLVIVPWGLLHSLPFHALLDGDEYLIDRFSISYAPSATIFSLRQPPPAEASQRSLILAVDSESTPFVRAEAEAVAAAVHSPEVLFGSEATEANLREKGAGSSIIHIATHGHFRADNPMFSSIRLASSYLSLYDLYHMSLPADLLTLSGCVTGLNLVSEGDELVGMARGLLYAGAKALLLSLWDIDDHVTADLMGLFYRALKTGGRKAHALQTAMREVRKSHPHPYFWAPFKLTATAQSE